MTTTTVVHSGLSLPSPSLPPPRPVSRYCHCFTVPLLTMIKEQFSNLSNALFI